MRVLLGRHLVAANGVLPQHVPPLGVAPSAQLRTALNHFKSLCTVRGPTGRPLGPGQVVLSGCLWGSIRAVGTDPALPAGVNESLPIPWRNPASVPVGTEHALEELDSLLIGLSHLR